MTSFFPVRDIPLRFNSINLFFSPPIVRVQPTLVQTLRRVHDSSYSELLAAKIFLGELLAKNTFRIFYRAKAIFFSPACTVSVEMMMSLH